MKTGRPKKFESVEELDKLIKAYFDSCFEPVYRQVVLPQYRGKPMRELTQEAFTYEAVLNPDGTQKVKQIEPLTITGLALALGTTRETLLRFESGDYDSDESALKMRNFSDTIKAAKQKIENYVERQLFRDKNVTGVIFNLKNNYAWKDEQHIDHTSKGERITDDTFNKL